MALPIDPQEWANTKVKEPSNQSKIRPGVYVMVIRGVQNKGTYLEFKLDFAEGEKNAGFMMRQTNGSLDLWWSLLVKRSFYGNGDNSRFKGDITAIEKSNPGYNFAETGFEERTLIGKLVVGVLYEDEYLSNGELKVALKLDAFRSLEAFRNGEIQPRERDTYAMKQERERRKNEQAQQGLTGVYQPNTPNFNPNMPSFNPNNYNPNANPNDNQFNKANNYQAPMFSNVELDDDLPW